MVLKIGQVDNIDMIIEDKWPALLIHFLDKIVLKETILAFVIYYFFLYLSIVSGQHFERHPEYVVTVKHIVISKIIEFADVLIFKAGHCSAIRVFKSGIGKMQPESTVLLIVDIVVVHPRGK